MVIDDIITGNNNPSEGKAIFDFFRTIRSFQNGKDVSGHN